MIISLEGDNVLCLANVVAIYHAPGGTRILLRDGRVEESVFSPETLKKRRDALEAQAAVRPAAKREQPAQAKL